jgi:hypothetical protein
MMKTTMLTQPIANPRRTRLAQLKDAEEPATQAAPEEVPAPEVQLPRQTANPRRTVLDKLPTG